MTGDDGIEVIGGRRCCRADRLQKGMTVSVGFGCGVIAEIRFGDFVEHGGVQNRRVTVRLDGDSMCFTWWATETVYLEPATHLRDLQPPFAT